MAASQVKEVSHVSVQVGVLVNWLLQRWLLYHTMGVACATLLDLLHAL